MKPIRPNHMLPAFFVIICLLVLTIGRAAADPQARGQTFLPVVSSPGQNRLNCDLAQKNFGTVGVHGEPQSGDPETNIDINLGYRGYAPTDAALRLVSINGSGTDSKAPQFPDMFADRRTAKIGGVYQRYRWDDTCNCPKDTYSPWDVTVLGLVVRPGETIFTPESGYDIGGGYEYQVMYAGDTGITLYIGLDDDFHGYVVHIEDVCVDPDLLNLYRELHNAGRKELPALRGHQAFGRAYGTEIKVAVRDSGHFLDPRSRLDWWRGR